jgi:hypothetical protein
VLGCYRLARRRLAQALLRLCRQCNGHERAPVRARPSFLAFSGLSRLPMGTLVAPYRAPAVTRHSANPVAVEMTFALGARQFTASPTTKTCGSMGLAGHLDFCCRRKARA